MQTNERLFLLRLALHAYQAEQGIYPKQLTDLVPAYLHEVPVDPFGRGQPLRYRVEEASYFAQSVSPDGINSNATPIPLKKGHQRAVAEKDSQGDIVVSAELGEPVW